MKKEIVTFDPSLEPDSSTPSPDRLLAGRPEQHVWNHFTDSTQQFFAGRWASTRGKWRVRYTENELCHLTTGRIRIASDDGKAWTFAAGETFVVPAGFEGTWEVIEDCTKLYAIFQSMH
jgi:hypothetical protein